MDDADPAHVETIGNFQVVKVRLAQGPQDSLYACSVRTVEARILRQGRLD
jgi:hypothetical protein